MSLHCPARFVVVSAPSALALDTIEALRGERVALVCAARAESEAAKGVAVLLACPVDVLDAPLDNAWAASLTSVADLHRGETVVLVVPADVSLPSRFEIGDDGIAI